MSIRYTPGQFKRSLYQHDWYNLFQELTTILIGGGIGIYCYETKALIGPFKLFAGTPGSDVLATSDQPFTTAGLAIIIIAAFIKVLIYASIFDPNQLKGRGVKKKKRRGFDFNGVLQEITTILLGFAIGLFADPVVKNAIIFESTEYPDPTPGILLTVACLFVKLLLYSKALNFNQARQSSWQPQKIKPFLGKYDWNEFFQEFSSTFIGLGAGFYMYQSGWVAKYFPGLFEKAKEEASSFLDPILGTELIKQLGITSIWENQTAKPYLTAGIAIIAVCILLKFFIYSGVYNMNRLRDSMMGKHGRNYSYRADTNEIADEIVTLLLTIIFGIVAAPIVKNAFMDEKDPNSLIWAGGVALLFLGWLKIALMTGAIQIGNSKKRPKKKVRRR